MTRLEEELLAELMLIEVVFMDVKPGNFDEVYGIKPDCSHSVVTSGKKGEVWLPYDICKECGEVLRHG